MTSGIKNEKAFNFLETRAKKILKFEILAVPWWQFYTVLVTAMPPRGDAVRYLSHQP